MVKRAAIAAALLLMINLAGCATVAPNADAPNAGEPEWLEDLKALKGTGTSIGVSREARAIESSLGTR